MTNQSPVESSRKTLPPNTPKRKSVLSKLDETYIEEEDETYVYNETIEVEEYSDDLEGDVAENTPIDDTVSEIKRSIPFDIIPADQKIGEFKQFLIKHEIARKVLHSSFGFVSLWLYTQGANQKQVIIPLITVFTVLFVNDYIRFHNPELNKVLVQAFWWVVRESEISHYNGILYYCAGLVWVFSLLPKDISMMSVLLLSWADTAASTVGRRFGKYTFQISKNKSFAGAFASFTTGVLSCYLLYGYFIPHYPHVNHPGDILWAPETSKINLHLFAFLCGVITSFSECVNLFNIDDNFVIPVLSGYLLYGLVNLTKIHL